MTEVATQSSKIPTVTLNDGVVMPWLGYGTSGVSLDDIKTHDPDRITDPTKDPAYEAVKHAIRAGYRFIDTAALYLNEETIGSAVADAIKEGLVTREELFICTKVWCTAHKRSSVMLACQESLKKLRMSYVDLYLIHWPVAYLDRYDQSPPFEVSDRLINPKDPKTNKLLYSDTHYTETWLGMQDVKDAKLARSIGVSNFNHRMIDEILQMPGLKYPPSCNQMEMHPYLNVEKLVAYSREKNIVLHAYCPLGAPGAPWLPPNLPEVINDPLVCELAQKYKKSRAQIILRFHLQRGVAPIPKSLTPSRIEENMNVFDFELSGDDLERLMGLNKNLRYCTNTAGEYVTDHPLYPFHEDY